MPGSAFVSRLALLATVLISLCFVATGNAFWPGALLAVVVVPTGMRTYLVLVRRRAAGRPLTLLSSFKTVLTSAALSAVFGLWFIIVSLQTAIMRDSDLAVIPLAILFGLVICLGIVLGDRTAPYVAEHWGIKPNWRQLVRVRFSVRGMLVGVAFVALVLWPVHSLWMRSTYDAIATYEGLIAGLCGAESELMAERAERCRRRASEGTPWDLSDEFSQNLKLCPFPGDGPGRSWLHQAEIWERAAERCRLAAQRHKKIHTRYAAWGGLLQAR